MASHIALLLPLFAISLAGQQLSLEPVAVELNNPTAIAFPPDGSGRMFVVEQCGRIVVFEEGSEEPSVFLDLSYRIRCEGEQGMLSIAFPPGFDAKQYVYICYVDFGGQTVISRFLVSSADPSLADEESEAPVLIFQPVADEHIGGQLAFSPKDGYLYVGVGDGDELSDPRRHAQDPTVPFGKILRLDVESEVYPYQVPDSNPFLDQPGYLPYIWATGLRNPWRFSFDRATGDLYIGDVGQVRWEEIDFQPANSRGGENYGWNTLEASECFEAYECEREGFTLPILEYTHLGSDNCAVIGGFVYRGRKFPAENGRYLYADFCSGLIWDAAPFRNEWTSTELVNTGLLLSTFGEDQSGELYVAAWDEGVIYRLRFEE